MPCPPPDKKSHPQGWLFHTALPKGTASPGALPAVSSPSWGRLRHRHPRPGKTIKDTMKTVCCPLLLALLLCGCAASPSVVPFRYDNGPDYVREGLYRIVDDRGRMGYADTTAGWRSRPVSPLPSPSKAARRKSRTRDSARRSRAPAASTGTGKATPGTSSTRQAGRWTSPKSVGTPPSKAGSGSLCRQSSPPFRHARPSARHKHLPVPARKGPHRKNRQRQPADAGQAMPRPPGNSPARPHAQGTSSSR